MNNPKSTNGFTLVEIMVVVLIIGILATLAGANFIRARETTQRNICLNNQRILNDAADQYAMAAGLEPGASVQVANLTGYVKREALCPVGKRPFNSISIGTSVSCPNNLPNHVP